MQDRKTSKNVALFSLCGNTTSLHDHMTIYLNQRAVEHIWGSGDPWPYCCIVHSTGCFWNWEGVLSRDIQIRNLWPPYSSAGLGAENTSKAIDQRFTSGRFNVSKMETHMHHTTISWLFSETLLCEWPVFESMANYFQLQGVQCVCSLFASYYPANTDSSCMVPLWVFFSIFKSSYLIYNHPLFML